MGPTGGGKTGVFFRLSYKEHKSINWGRLKQESSHLHSHHEEGLNLLYIIGKFIK